MTNTTIERTVEFLNVDLELTGSFDRPSLLRGLGDVHVLTDTADLLALELADGPDATLVAKLTAFTNLVGQLAPDARAAWDAASTRVLDVGIQSGLEPHSTTWTLPPSLLASLAAIDVELRLTIYGAEYVSNKK